jgi:hypothetical protein
MKKHPLEIVTVRIKAEQRRRIIELSEKLDISASLVLRKMLDEGLKHYRNEIKFSPSDGKAAEG